MYISDFNYIEELSIVSPRTYEILEFRVEQIVGGVTVIYAIVDDPRPVGSRFSCNDTFSDPLEVGRIAWTSVINGKFTLNSGAEHTPQGEGFIFLLKMLGSGRFTQAEARRFQLKLKRSSQKYVSY